MSKTKTYIELNGTTYDATNGGILRRAGSKPVGQPATQTSTPHHTQAIDGIVRQGSAHKPPKVIAKPISKPRLERVAHQAPMTRRKTQHSATLMRQAVRKPAFGALFHAKATPVAAEDVKPASKRSLLLHNQDRRNRAQAITKSDLVSKFSSGRLLAKMKPLAIVEPSHPKQTAKHTVQPAAKSDLISKALATATTHQRPTLKKIRLHHRLARKLHIKPRLLGIGAALVSALLIGGLFIYHDLPNLNVRLAAARAGFHASLPSYQPAGFALKGPIQYAPGELTLNFQSNSDSRNFQVKQQSSSWNSETLLEAYVAKHNQPYQTYEDNGRTVYINNTGANLVTDNKWIQVQSDGSLSTEQLLNIIKSIN